MELLAEGSTPGRIAGIKEKMKVATRDELITILASDGMMLKRPILIGDGFILTGFKEEVWKNSILSK